MHRRGREVCPASTARVRAAILDDAPWKQDDGRKDLLRRITVNPAILGGKPIVRGKADLGRPHLCPARRGRDGRERAGRIPIRSGMTCGPALPSRTLSWPAGAWRPTSWYPLAVPGRCLRDRGRCLILFALAGRTTSSRQAPGRHPGARRSCAGRCRSSASCSPPMRTSGCATARPPDHGIIQRTQPPFRPRMRS